MHMSYSHCTGVDILSDIVLNPLLGEREIDRERGVILREMEVRNCTATQYKSDMHLYS